MASELIFLLSGAAALALFMAVAVGARKAPGALPFAGMMLSLAVWSAGYGLELSATSLDSALFWLRFEYLGIPLLPAFWLAMALEIMIRPPRRRWWAYLPLLPAAAVSAGVLWDRGHRFFHLAPRLEAAGRLSLLVFKPGPFYWGNVAYAWLLLAAGLFVTLRASRRDVLSAGRYRLFVVLSALAPMVFNVAYHMGVRPWGILDLTPFGFAISGLLLLWGIFNTSLFALAPAARAHVFDRIPEGILIGDEHGYLADRNAAAERLLGPLKLGAPLQDSPGIWPSLLMAMRLTLSAEDERPPQMLTSPDREATVFAFGSPRRGRGVVALVRDIRDRVESERELRHRERLLARLSEVAQLLLPARGMPDLNAIVRHLGEATSADIAMVGLNELREDGALCFALQALWRAENAPASEGPDLPPRIVYEEAGLSQWRRRLEAGEIIHGRRHDFSPGEEAFLQARQLRAVILIPLFVEEGFTGVVGLARLHRDELWSPVEQEFLRNAALYLSQTLRRQRVEENLRQSQKLDTVGRLAGGIAHDFNNLLQAINGYTEMALVGMAEDDPRSADLREVLKAGQRAAALTQQLLSFSRRQNIKPEPTDAHAVLNDMRKLLKRLIGERIALQFVLEARDSIVEVAAPHIEQMVLNLAVNARDAMPAGGVIRVLTRNAEMDAAQARAKNISEGRYLALSVEDTGVGMSPEVLSHIFEPFFTTKPRGHGTGLGLATVYGLVHQHRGHISVQSTVGQGSQFTLLLPLCECEIRAASAPALPQSAAGGGTLLVVEDEDAVRRLWSQVLATAGYAVLEAESGEAALDVAHRHGGSIDLLITDVVMPGLSGRQIAAILSAERPNMKVLLISGYPDDDEVVQTAKEGAWPLLNKPVSTENLLLQVRQLLNQGMPA